MVRRTIKGVTKAAAVAPPPPPPTAAVDTAPATLAKIEAPYYTAGMVQLQATGNDVLMIFMRPHPTIDTATKALTNFGIMDATAIVSLSPQTAKDLSIILSELIANTEKQFGELETPMMIRRREGKN